MPLKPTRFAVLLAGFVASYGANADGPVAIAESAAASLAVDAELIATSQAASSTTDIGKIQVEGTEGPSASGLIAPESTPKARSAVDKAYIEKKSPTENPFQSLSLLPGVATNSTDASGLFGGAIRVRGFNSDQLGFTVNGVPVNDSGNFAVFPQEYTDSENLCNIFLTQGAADNDAPHTGASGGNIGLSTCAPKDTFGVKVAQTGGSLKLSRTYAKIETGLVGGIWKSYVSYSRALIDKFKGDGRADRHHVDFVTTVDLGRGSRITGNFLYNRALNNNFRTLTRPQINTFGRAYDFGLVAPRHLTPSSAAGAAGVQNESLTIAQGGSTPNNGDGYFGFNLNPFRNYILSVNAGFQLTPTFRFDLTPYLWHGYGTGGGQLASQTEAVGANIQGGGVGDLNGDGDTRDTILIYRSNVTTTYRPGVTAQFTKSFEHHKIVFGYWAEKARHRQTAPGQRILSGDPSDPLRADTVVDRYFDSPYAWIRNRDGSVTNTRDQLTRSTGKSLFISDTITLFDDKLTITPGFRHSGQDRDFNNFPNIGAAGVRNGFGAYRIQVSAIENLPSLGISYQLNDSNQVFANGSRSFRVPSNFIYQNLATGGTFVNGVYTNYRVEDLNLVPETTNNFDLGYRFASEKVTASATAFYSLFQNRLAVAFDQEEQRSTDTNVGGSKAYGVELEGAWNFYRGFTAYASSSYTRSLIKENLRTAANTFENTAGKTFPDTPVWLGALNLQYARNNYYVFIEGKYTGRRQATLVNDQSVAGYALMNIGAGYTFAPIGPLKNVKLVGVVNNATNQEYDYLNAGSGSNFTTRSQGTGGAQPSYFIGAPVSFAVTLSTEF